MAEQIARDLAWGLASLQTSLGVVPGSWGIMPALTVAAAPAYSMVGAASVLAAMFSAPLTAAMLLFELTRDYDIVLPIVASAGVAVVVSEGWARRESSK